MNTAAFPELMVAIAEGRAPQDVMNAVVKGIAACRHVALARLWIIEPGDRCATCTFAAECADHSACLHLVASAGNPSVTATPNSSSRFARFPLGVRKIGTIAASGKAIVHRDLKSAAADRSWIADPEWIAREDVNTFAGEPLVHRGKVLGVLGLFDRRIVPDPDLKWLRIFADHAAVSLANARAFAEIESLKLRLEQENETLREDMKAVVSAGGLIGDSEALAKVRQQIALVAGTDAAVLITGESGTGKELVAHAVHENSKRSARPLVKVNCSAIPENLFESEFFGHVKGAFTGALSDRPGRFEIADGGTIFLDEIGEVPLSMQAKLLRVLQEREFERVGDTRTRRVNVRVVAATNRDLRREIEAGRFRQDLYFRLSVFPIEIPPLRERRSDIAALATRFAALAARRLGRQPRSLTRSALDSLEAYDWPGNVRELQNAVERATILASDGVLRFDLPAASRSQAREGSVARKKDGDAIETRDDLRRRERDAITAALARTNGRVFGKGGAAELLAMRPTTLASRMKALGITKPR